MSQQDGVGGLGESFVQHILHQPVFDRIKFKVTFLGEKYQLFDFMVNLLDDNMSMAGPFFLIQVKTHQVASFDDAVEVVFTAEQVSAAKERNVPSYLVGVQTCGRRQKGYFVALDRRKITGVYSVPKRHDIESELNMQKLYKEVELFFSNSIKNQFQSMFS